MSNNKLANLNTLKVDFADFWDQFVGVGVEEGEKPAKKYKPQYNPEYVFLQFDENILYEKDFQGMRDKTKIKDIMEKEKLKYGKILQKCFSD